MSVPTVSWSETSPAGSDNIALGDNRIRELKTQIREVIDIDHQFNSSGQDADNGKHTKVSFLEQADLGTGAAGKPILGAQTVSGKPELVFTDEDDNDIQLTSGGKRSILSASDDWRAGDLLFTTSTTAPTGWTDVSATYEDKFIRITSGTPLTTGGSDTHDHGAATGSTTLTASQSGLPSHTHGIAVRNANGWNGTDQFIQASNDAGASGTINTNSGGGSAASSGHTHTISSANNIPAYIELRMMQKD